MYQSTVKVFGRCSIIGLADSAAVAIVMNHQSDGFLHITAEWSVGELGHEEAGLLHSNP